MFATGARNGTFDKLSDVYMNLLEGPVVVSNLELGVKMGRGVTFAALEDMDEAGIVVSNVTKLSAVAALA